MSVSGRERIQIQRLISAGARLEARSLDLFAQRDALELRKTHLGFVIRRLARRLNIEEPSNLELFGIEQLDSIRLRLAQQIAQLPK